MSNKGRRGLGRGLDSFLGPAAAETAAKQGSSAPSLPIDALRPNPHQPRSEFDEEQLAGLADSIGSRGIVQPIVVKAGDDGYVIVAGERRWRAARLAGLEEVPVVERQQVSDQEMLELALIENLQRADLDPIDEALAFAALRDRHQLSQVDIARAVGKSRAAVANVLRLLELPDAVQGWLRDGSLTAGQARPLLALGDAAAIVAMAEKARSEGLSARRVEDLVRRQGRRTKRSRRKQEQEVHAAAAEERLTRALQTKVEIQRRGNKGTIRIHFHSEDELIRLFDRLHSAKGS